MTEPRDPKDTPDLEPKDSDKPGSDVDLKDIPEQWKGKSKEELVAILKDKEQNIGKQAKELGDLRKGVDTSQSEAAFYRQTLETEMAKAQAAASQKDQTPEPEKKEGEDFDWDHPGKSIRTYIDDAITTYQRKVDATAAERNYYAGMRNANEKRPELFKGIEKDAQQLVYAAYRQGTLNAHSLSDPETWYYAAGLINMRKSDFKPTSSTSPVKPTETERPSSTKAGTEETEEIGEFQDNIKGLHKFLSRTEPDLFKGTEEERTELVKKERKRKDYGKEER